MGAADNTLPLIAGGVYFIEGMSIPGRILSVVCNMFCNKKSLAESLDPLQGFWLSGSV
jgi:hypothetical protein